MHSSDIAPDIASNNKVMTFQALTTIYLKKTDKYVKTRVRVCAHVQLYLLTQEDHGVANAGLHSRLANNDVILDILRIFRCKHAQLGIGELWLWWIINVQSWMAWRGLECGSVEFRRICRANIIVIIVKLGWSFEVWIGENALEENLTHQGIKFQLRLRHVRNAHLQLIF